MTNRQILLKKIMMIGRADIKRVYNDDLLTDDEMKMTKDHSAYRANQTETMRNIAKNQKTKWMRNFNMNLKSHNSY